MDESVRRRAIEALRSGVPSRDAVAALGSGQTAIEDRFAALREAVAAGRPGALLLGGGFGAGKSHLLEHPARLAAGDGFVVSRVVISKETPLHDPAKVFLAAADAATADAFAGPAISAAATGLDPQGREYAELLRWSYSARRPERAVPGQPGPVRPHPGHRRRIRRHDRTVLVRRPDPGAGTAAPAEGVRRGAGVAGGSTGRPCC